MTRAGVFLDLALLLFVTALIALYAVALNAIFYTEFGPFYDSLSYLNRMAHIMTVSAGEGIVAGIRAAAVDDTVFLPFVEAALLASFSKPARWHAVLIQFPWIAAYVVSGYFYFRCCAAQRAVPAICLSISLICFSAVVVFNGGLADFRMDLLQAVTFGTSIALYLIAREKLLLSLWLLFGLAVAICCLCRATAPVYMVLVFGPLFLLDIVGPRRAELLKGIMIGVATASVLSGWFFVLNFDRLYYYYFVWNPDANAHLPIRQSAMHIDFVRHAIGRPIGLVLLLGLVLGLANARWRSLQLNWRALWAGIVPVSYLVLSGSGLNPFVSMVSIPGIMLFLLAPLKSSEGPRFRWLDQRVVAAAAMLASAVSLSAGIANHRTGVSEWVPSGRALREIAGLIVNDAAAGGELRSYSFAAAYSGALDARVIANVLVFDNGFTIDGKTCLSNGVSRFESVTLGLSSLTEWKAIGGASDEEKLNSLAERIVSSADFIILVDPSTPPIAHKHTPVNPLTGRLNELILSHGADLKRLGGPIAVSRIEKVHVYRNHSRSPSAKRRC